MAQPVIFLTGPTASGKTETTLALIERYPVEIISVDSANVYQEMDIGTAKPDLGLRRRAPHHLIDILPPTAAYSAARFREDALALIRAIHARGRIPVLAGGTMLYYHALEQGVHDLPAADPEVRAALAARAAEQGWPALHAELARQDPVTAQRLSPNDSQRIGRALEVLMLTRQPLSALLASERPDFPYSPLKLAFLPQDRAWLHARIAARFDAMLTAGLVAEVEGLLSRYDLDPDLPAMRAVGYRQALEYVRGEADWATMRERGISATRQLAKRQITWLRSMQGMVVADPQDPQAGPLLLAAVEHYLKTAGL